MFLPDCVAPGFNYVLLVSSVRREGQEGWSHSAESPSHLTTLNIDGRSEQLSLQRSKSKVVMTGEQQGSGWYMLLH